MAKGTKKVGAKKVGAKRIGKTQKRIGAKRIGANTKKVGAKKVGGKWSMKYKKSINCNRPKGFSQKQHCKYGRKMRGGRVHNPWESETDVIKREKRKEMTGNQRFADELKVGNQYKIVLDPKINSEIEIKNMRETDRQKGKEDEKFNIYSAVYLRLVNKTKTEGQYSLQFLYITNVTKTDDEKPTDNLPHHIYVKVRPTFVFEEEEKKKKEEEEETSLRPIHKNKSIASKNNSPFYIEQRERQIERDVADYYAESLFIDHNQTIIDVINYMVNGFDNNNISGQIEIYLSIIKSIKKKLSEEAIALLDFYENFKKNYGDTTKEIYEPLKLGMTVIPGTKFDYETNFYEINKKINEKIEENKKISFVFTDFEQTITFMICDIPKDKNAKKYKPDQINLEKIDEFFFKNNEGLQSKGIDFAIITDMENSDIEKNGKNCLDYNWGKNRFVYNENVFGMPHLFFKKKKSVFSHNDNDNDNDHDRLIDLLKDNVFKGQKPLFIEENAYLILDFLKAINKLKCIDEYLFKKAKLAANPLPEYEMASESITPQPLEELNDI